MFLGTARAQLASTGFPLGERHAIIAFALAEHLYQASQLAQRHFADSGWGDVALERGAELDPDKLITSDPVAAQSYEDCLAHGTAGIVFSDPLDE